MTFYERERGGRNGSRELSVGSSRELIAGVLDRHQVSRIATIVDGNTLKVRHDLVSYPGIHNGWPREVVYVGKQVNNALLWLKPGEDGKDQRIIWKPQPGIRE